MISVATLDGLITQHTPAAQLRDATCDDPWQTVIGEEIATDRDLPPFDRVTMDGIAVWIGNGTHSVDQWSCEGRQAAGQPQTRLQDGVGGCIEVMTGAMLPEGTNAVIPYEHLRVLPKGFALHHPMAVKVGQNIHPQGADCRKGDVIVPKGTVMDASHWAMCASVGRQSIKVAGQPRIHIITTGDELVPVAVTPKPYQVRRSNDCGIKAMLVNHQFTAITHHHSQDDVDQLYRLLQDSLHNCDYLLITGGVSQGQCDYVPQILADLKVLKLAHGVAQKPGKPLWYGVGPDNQQVFGLPGNPVSTFVTLRRYVIPSLYRARGYYPHRLSGRLATTLRFTPALTLFAPVHATCSQEGTIAVVPITNQGSGDFVALGASNGFIELPADKDTHLADNCYPLYLWSRSL